MTSFSRQELCAESVRNLVGPFGELNNGRNSSDLVQIWEPKKGQIPGFLSSVGETVRCWARGNNSPHKDLGRPIIKLINEAQGYTVDFASESKDNGKLYVGGIKCELEYQNYKYLTLCSRENLCIITDPRFRNFWNQLTNPLGFKVTVGSKSICVSGSILVGADVRSKAESVSQMQASRSSAVENLIKELVKWENKEFVSLLADYETWISKLFFRPSRNYSWIEIGIDQSSSTSLRY